MKSKPILSSLSFLMVLTFSTTAQQQSVGLRLGDPVGITYKKYYNRSHAVELGIGTAPAHWSSNYYLNSFNEYARYNNYRYRNHTVQSTLYLQGRYVWHYRIPAENLDGTLEWYGGAGALFKAAKVQYRFQNREAPFAAGTDVITDFDLGAEGIAGLEYTFPDVPITIFGEASLFLELADRPFTMRVLGGLGVRYNFRRR
ncbi:MAG: hypothetical protein J0L66_06270 [Cytophagales bacterium]|nr:hypothetical protein [Cytophagales bacterium]